MDLTVTKFFHIMPTGQKTYKQSLRSFNKAWLSFFFQTHPENQSKQNFLKHGIAII